MKTSFAGIKNISHIKLYADTFFVFNVYKQVNGRWEKVPSLCLDARELLDTWNTIQAKEIVPVRELLFEFIPHPNVRKESILRELEIWSMETTAIEGNGVPLYEKNINSGDDLQIALENGATNFLVFEGSQPAQEWTDPNISTVNIDLAIDPHQIKRAFLVYDGLNIYAPINIEKRINSLSWIGGYALPVSGLDPGNWKTQFEEINPAWLVRGNNQIEFRLNDEFSIANMRLAIETYNGWNVVQKISKAPAYDFDANTTVTLAGSVGNNYLDISFDRTVEPEYVMLQLQGTVNGQAKIQYSQNGKWLDVAEDWSVDLGSMDSGWNKIVLPAPVATNELRLSIQPSSGASYAEIDEIRVCASPVGQRSGKSDIVISYPLNGEYFDETAYIQGFVRHSATALNIETVKVESKPVGNSIEDGAFDVAVPRKETRFKDLEESEPWDLLVESKVEKLQNGDIVKDDIYKYVHLYNHIQSTSGEEDSLNGDSGGGNGSNSNGGNGGNSGGGNGGNSGAGNGGNSGGDNDGLLNFFKKLFSGDDPTVGREKHTEKIIPGQAKKIRYRDIIIDIPEGAVDSEVDITIIPLNQEEVPQLDAGMINVTFPAAGYRFLPHGMKFKKAIKLSFGYSKDYFLDKQKDDEVSMYFFHENAKKWLPLKKVSVDPSTSLVTSETDHFTDIINATLIVPEHPDALTYNPNTIKDIKAADPSAGINLIEPPQANNKGDAQLTYSLEVPPGRNGMQPQLAVSYDSSRSNGWMGIGWDIPLQAISIDTRWGVPRYSSSDETETYTLNGEMLTPVAHRGQWEKRSAEKVFHTRIEGNFQKIVRHGTSPKNYWWEVTDKSGARYFYGGEPGRELVGDAVLSDGAGGNVFKWCLHKMQDPNGNTIEYTYAGSAVGNNGAISGQQRYLKKIAYTGNSGFAPPYSVTFVRDRELPGFEQRPDIITDARGGMKTITADLLKRVEVRYKDEMVRSYGFLYEEGAYKKTRLAAISQFDDAGKLFNTHAFGYFNETQNQDGSYKGFADAGVWNTHHDDKDATALSGADGTNIGGHIYVGIGLVKQGKNLSGGLDVGFGRGDSEGTMALLDLNGDGIQDKIFKDGNGFAYRPGTLQPDGMVSYAANKVPISLPAISREETESVNFGGSINIFVLRFGVTASENMTTATSYFSDVNGDGLVDVVNGGTVFFNHLVNGVPTFTLNSELTPVPIESGGGVTADIIDDAAMERREKQREDQFPLVDIVRRWQAPFAGNIAIKGGVRLRYSQQTLKNDKAYDKADGVRVAIQHNGSELWHHRLEVPETDAANEAVALQNVENIPVSKGDRIYFRVQSVDDGAYDEVLWDPEIVYLNVPALVDANNFNPYRFKAAEDFTFAGRENSITMPLKGTIRLVGDFVKSGATSDDVTVVVERSGEVVFSRTIAADKIETISLDEEIEIGVAGTIAVDSVGLKPSEMADAGLQPGDQFDLMDTLECYVQVDSAIDVQKIQWVPEVYYTAADNQQSVVAADGSYYIRFNPPYDVDLYPSNKLESHQQAWTATQTGALVAYPELAFEFGDKKPSADIFFTIKSNGRLLGKRKIEIREGELPDIDTLWVYLPEVQEGETLFYDFSTRDHSMAAYLDEAGVNFVYGAQNGWTAPENGLAELTPDIAFDPPGDNTPSSSKVLWTVRRGNELLAARLLDIQSGQFVDPASHKTDIEVLKDERLIFNYWTPDQAIYNDSAHHKVNVLWEGVTSPIIGGLQYAEDSFVAVLHSSSSPALFTESYRSWSFASYNSFGDNSDKPLDESAFENPEDYFRDVASRKAELELNKMRSFPLAPELSNPNVSDPSKIKNRWGGVDEECWVKQESMSSSRLGLNNIHLPRSRDFAGASAVPRMSIGETTSTSLGLIITGSEADGESYSVLDYMDMNGDRFPDILGKSNIVYTGPTGAMGVGSAGNNGIRTSDNTTWSLGASSGQIVQDVKGLVNGYNKPPGGTTGSPANADPRIGFSASGSVSGSDSDVTSDLRDINGDGLPDKVSQSGVDVLVSLNQGNSFGPFENWGAVVLEKTSSETQGAGGGFNSAFGNYSLGGGVNVTTNQARTERSLIDVNGDGLPDAIVAMNGQFSVAFNTGAGFAPAVAWPGSFGNELTLGETVGLDGGVYFSINITFTWVELTINPGINASGSISRQPMTIKDVNGDGYPDHLLSPDSGSLNVALNQHGKTNLLQKITRPLGSAITLDYKLDGNTYEMPQSKWLLESVIVEDGHAGDGVDIQVMGYDYEKPYYDRLEREFYGYEVVAVEQGDKTSGAYRKTVRTFRNDSYYSKGMLTDETLFDRDAKPFIKTVNNYRFVDIVSGYEKDLADKDDKTLLIATIFPQLFKTEKYFYEGQEQPGKYTYTTFVFDEYGNVKEFTDAADSDDKDDVTAIIEYDYKTTPYIMNRPKSMQVFGSDGALYRERLGEYDARGNLRFHKGLIKDGDYAVTEIQYYDNGNIRTVIGPPNDDEQKYTLTYTYDASTQSFVERITDSFGYESSAIYDYRFGQPLKTKDLNNNVIKYQYDSIGRTEKIWGPYDIGAGVPTIQFSYHPDAAVPWALTRNKEHWEGSGTIDTLLYIDGLQRVLQTKKEAEVLAGDEKSYGMTVSGKVIYDALGRALQQGQPVFEGGFQTGFLTQAAPKNPTIFEYDVLDRTTATAFPNDEPTLLTTEYGFEDGLFLTQTTDPKVKVKKTVKDVRGAILAVKELVDSDWLVTSYEYDPLTQIKKVTDARGNATIVDYDKLGRRVSISNPDTGLVAYGYDKAGNLTGKVTPNLRQAEQAVNYIYEYNRLATIDYPDMADVSYTYGDPGEAFNRAGRIVTIANGDINEERFYGKLGETVKSTKSIRSESPGHNWLTYTTEYSFDSFGRMRQLTYPDGEVLTYTY
ncbi:MAG: SpvB/TcaC N-terminal domain-containing protein, partial [Thermodesulfobacteriota bacterium]